MCKNLQEKNFFKESFLLVVTNFFYAVLYGLLAVPVAIPIIILFGFSKLYFIRAFLGVLNPLYLYYSISSIYDSIHWPCWLWIILLFLIVPLTVVTSFLAPLWLNFLLSGLLIVISLIMFIFYF